MPNFSPKIITFISIFIMIILSAIIVGLIISSSNVDIRGIAKKDDNVGIKVSYQSSDKSTEKNRLNKLLIDVAKSSLPFVVSIQTEKRLATRMIPEEEEFWNRFFEVPRDTTQTALGSGVIVSSDGYILTNNHVIESAKEIKVLLFDKREFLAEIVGTDPKSDIAVIKIKDSNLPIAKLGDSDKTEVGEIVVAIGNPFGLKETVTVGIISAKGRANVNLADYEDFIQTDASINPGNSGGALVNLDGEVIGINTAIAERVGTYSGIGFAIPINMAKKIMQELIEKGKVTRGWLGVMIRDVDKELAYTLGLEKVEGILIEDVLKNTPAEKSGIQRGDVIIEFDNKKVENANQFRHTVANTEVNKNVNVVIIRNKDRITIPIQVGELPQDPLAISKTTNQQSPSEKLGLTVQELTPVLARQMGIDEDVGLVITKVKPGSIAEEKGLREGDIIKEVNRQKIFTKAEFEGTLAQIKKGESVLLLVKQGNYTQFIVINIP